MVKPLSLCILLLLLNSLCQSFVCKSSSRLKKRTPTSLKARKDTAGQGFGKKKKVHENSASRDASELKSINIMNPGAGEDSGINSTTMNSDSESRSSEMNLDPVDLDAAIESSKLFKTTRARQEALLDEKIARLREEEEMLATDPSVGAVPEIVADRMIGRIATFFGIPVFGGLAIFVGAYFYSKQTDTVIQPNIIAYATQVPFVLGLLGITYGIMSASWEPDKEGSNLGIDEFKTNFARVKDGLKRTRETAELKDDIERDSKKLGR